MPLDPVDAGRLRDMVDYAEEAIQILGSLDAWQLKEDRKTFLAVTRCLEVVGGAGWKLSEAIKQSRGEVPWPLISGMRHKLGHDDGRVDVAIVHRVIREHLPNLLRRLRAILDDDAI